MSVIYTSAQPGLSITAHNSDERGFPFITITRGTVHTEYSLPAAIDALTAPGTDADTRAALRPAIAAIQGKPR